MSHTAPLIAQPPFRGSGEPRLTFELEDRIFDLLLSDEKRKTCGALTMLNKEYYARFAPRFWHTIIFRDSTIQKLGAVLMMDWEDQSQRSPRHYIRRVIVTDVSDSKDTFWRMTTRSNDGNDKSPKYAKRHHLPNYYNVPFDRLLPNMEELVLCEISFTIAFGLYIHDMGFHDGDNSTDMDYIHFSMPNWAMAVRDMIYDSKPCLRLFWDLDFPFTYKTYEKYRKANPYLGLGGEPLKEQPSIQNDFDRLKQSGVVRAIFETLIPDYRYKLGELLNGPAAHFSVLTLWNLSPLQRIPRSISCDILHVVVNRTALDEEYVSTARGGKGEYVQLEHGLELILECNAHKILIQGLKDLCDPELEQAAEEVLRSYKGLGGSRTFDRLPRKVRYGPRRHADVISAKLHPSGIGGPIDLAMFEPADSIFPPIQPETDDPPFSRN